MLDFLCLDGPQMKYKTKILVLNCGSSSLKFKVISFPEEIEIVSGEAEKVGVKSTTSSRIKMRIENDTYEIKENLPDHFSAFKTVVNYLQGKINFDIIGHRYVHPGNEKKHSLIINEESIRYLESTLHFAPLHNPVSFSMIKFSQEIFPDIPQYAVFDISFHNTIQPEFSTYALPLELSQKYNIKRYGFHGISHQYVMEEALKFLNVEKEKVKIISAHLGTGGSSLCAIKNGESIHNTMGFTPLEGLIMNTRSGDIDIGIVLYIMFLKKFTPDQMDNILNKQSGLAGIYKETSDLREIASRVNDDGRAEKAFDMYVRRIKKYIGFYFLILEGFNVLIFTDTLGVEVPLLREKICDEMDFLGIKLDKEKNKNSTDYCLKDISADGSKVKILVVPTNEELMIAREIYRGIK